MSLRSIFQSRAMQYRKTEKKNMLHIGKSNLIKLLCIHLLSILLEEHTYFQHIIQAFWKNLYF